MAAERPQFVSAQPDEPWFIWQVHVYMQNLVDLGVQQNEITALFSREANGEASQELADLMDRFPQADIRLLPDERDERGRSYVPSIQPHLIEQWLVAEPRFEHQQVLYHDADVGFRRLPDFALMEQTNATDCFLSDSSAYIGHAYLHESCEKMRKELPDLPVDDLLVRMCAVVGIDPELVVARADAAGGAQYLLGGVGHEYWAKVYQDSLALHDLFATYGAEVGLEHEVGYYLQTWTAGMWAYLWNLWAADHETVVHAELDFLFSADSLDDNSPILHMAGVAGPRPEAHFNKSAWRQDNPIDVVSKQPYLFDGYDDGTVASEYAGLIQAAAGVKRVGLAERAPSRFWRVLSWESGPSKEIWDVERLHIIFDGDCTIVDHLASGTAGDGFEAVNAFDDSPHVWGGRAVDREGERPEIYLGVELDQPASPTMIALTNASGEQTPGAVLVQRSDDGVSWVTTSRSDTPQVRRHHVLLYGASEPTLATHWRLTATQVSQRFAWDIERARFVLAGHEQHRQLSASADAGTGFSIDNVTRDNGAPWGGRADDDGCFWITMSDDVAFGIDRIVLDQGTDHCASQLEVDYQVDGEWRPWRRFDGLQPGRNELFLYEEPPQEFRVASLAPAKPPAVEQPERVRPALDDRFADRRILVLIAAYRDTEVAKTVANALAQAAYPEHVRFAICNQHDDDTKSALDPWVDDPRFSIDQVHFSESQGCCWARHRTFDLYDDEPYILQIDAHSRFAARWDVRYIDMLESSDVDLPILTGYPLSYRIADGQVVYDLDAGLQRLQILEVRDDLTTLQRSESLEPCSVLSPSVALAAGQIFTRGSFCRDVRYDPNIYFAGEEISLAARAYTNGYDLFHPNENLLWHLYDHDQPKHWDDHNNHGQAHAQSVTRLKTLFQGDSGALGEYGLGNVRSLAEFEAMAGIQLRAAGAPDPSAAGPDESEVVMQLDRSMIEQRDDWASFVFVFFDDQGDEVARCAIHDPQVLCLARPTVRLAGIDIVAATQWTMVPVTHTGIVGAFAVRPFNAGKTEAS